MNNTITYRGCTLLDGPHNFFKLQCGVLPSFGFFRVTGSTTEPQLTDENNESLDLTLPGELTFSDGTNVVTLYNLYLVRATPAILTTGENTVWDIVLADERIMWPFYYGTQNYNTYLSDRTRTRDFLGEKDFELSNLNGAQEWSYEDIIQQLASTLSVSILGIPVPLRSPRNIVANGLPVPNILQRLFRELSCFIAPDITNQAQQFHLHALGAEENPAETAVLAVLDKYRYAGGQIYINPSLQRSDYATTLTAANTDDKVLDYGLALDIGGTGVYKIPSAYAALHVNEVIKNNAYLDIVGNELAKEYKDTYQNLWRDITYAGIWSNVFLGSVCQEIIWQSNSRGAFTRIRSFKPEEKELPGSQSTFFSYNGYPVPEIPIKSYFLGKPRVAYSSGATLVLDPCDINGVSTGENNITVQADYTLPVVTGTALNIPTTAIIPCIQAADKLWYIAGVPVQAWGEVTYNTTTHKLYQTTWFEWGWFRTTISDIQEITTAVNCTAV